MTIERLKHFTKQQESFDNVEQTQPTQPPTPGESSSTPAGPQVPQEDRWYVNASGYLEGTNINPQKDLGIAPIKGQRGGMFINRNLLSAQHHEMLEEDKLNTFNDSQSINVEDGIGELSRYIESNGEFPDLETFFEDKDKWGSFVMNLKIALTYHKPIESKEGMEETPAISIKQAKGEDKFTNEYAIREMNVGLSYVLLESLGKHLGYNSDDFRETIENLGDYVETDVDPDDIEGSFLNESNWWQSGIDNFKGAQELQDMLRPFTGVDHSITDYDNFMDYVEDSSNVPKLNFKYVTPASVYGVMTRSRAIGDGAELDGYYSGPDKDAPSAASFGLQYQDMMNHISEKFKIPKYFSYGNHFALPPVDENNNDIYMSRQDAQEFVDGYEAWENNKDKSSITLSDSKDKIDFNDLNKKTIKAKFVDSDEIKEVEVSSLRNMYARQKHFLSQEAHHTMSDEELKNTSFGKAKWKNKISEKQRTPGKIKDSRQVNIDDSIAQKEIFSESLDDFSGAKGHNALVGLDISYGLSHLLSTNQEKHDEIVKKLSDNALGEEGLFRDVKEKGDAEKKLNLVNNLNKKLWARLSEDDQKTLKQSANGFRDTLLNHQFKTNEQFLRLVAPDTDYVPIYRGSSNVLEGLGVVPSKTLYDNLDNAIDKTTLGTIKNGALESYYGSTEQPAIRTRGTNDYQKGIPIKPHSSLLTGGTQNISMAQGFAGGLDTGNVIVSKVPTSDFFHFPSLSRATNRSTEHEAIYVNRPTTQSKLVTRSRMANKEESDFARHPLGQIAEEIWNDFDTQENITKGETIMKEERKEPLEIIIPNFNEKTSDKKIQESLESYMEAAKTKNNIIRDLAEENLDS